MEKRSPWRCWESTKGETGFFSWGVKDSENSSITCCILEVGSVRVVPTWCPRDTILLWGTIAIIVKIVALKAFGFFPGVPHGG
ncbi:MAG: hypothetical protein CM1200mP36_02210 [Gammaproteobacteria bacterium]|nr:MAG: hypothetical protein CM1200mP36_02210 [Gammaproteobacteria bacterium]